MEGANERANEHWVKVGVLYAIPAKLFAFAPFSLSFLVRISMMTIARRACFAWALVAALAAFAPLAKAQTATYKVTFQGNWTTASVPGGVVGSAHFTTLVGAVHNDNVTFWESGGMATSGVEGVAELGSTGTFASEVNAAGSDAMLVRQNIGSSPVVTAAFDVDFSKERPLFTLLSMIGPSPDWFVGVSGLSLVDDQNKWIPELSMDLFPYDAGTEDGNGFSLGGDPTVPQGTIRRIKGEDPFSDEPMAMLSFELQHSVSMEGEELPTATTLSANYPNPFNPATTIRYGLSAAGPVRLAVYDVAGHEVAVLVDGPQAAGRYSVHFAAGDLSSGAYVYRLQTGEETIARTMLLVK